MFRAARKSGQPASAIAQRVGAALSEMQRPDHFRYCPSQEAATVEAHVTKAQSTDG